jgi:hypothetical protein
MANQFKPGGMGSKAGGPTPAEFQNSLAASIENALNTLLKNDGFDTLPDNNLEEARHRRRVFVAIAQGVIRHLKDNSDALLIVDAANKPTGEKIQVQVDGTLI